MDAAAPLMDSAISSVDRFPSMSHRTLRPPPARGHDVGEVLIVGDDDQVAFRCDSQHLGVGRRVKVEVTDVKRSRELRRDATNEAWRQALVEQVTPAHPGTVAILRSRSAA